MDQTTKPMEELDSSRLLRIVRVWTMIFIVGLVLSGVTAFPLQTETAMLVAHQNTLASRNAPPRCTPGCLGSLTRSVIQINVTRSLRMERIGLPSAISSSRLPSSVCTSTLCATSGLSRSASSRAPEFFHSLSLPEQSGASHCTGAPSTAASVSWDAFRC